MHVDGYITKEMFQKCLSQKKYTNQIYFSYAPFLPQNFITCDDLPIIQGQ